MELNCPYYLYPGTANRRTEEREKPLPQSVDKTALLD